VSKHSTRVAGTQQMTYSIHDDDDDDDDDLVS